MMDSCLKNKYLYKIFQLLHFIGVDFDFVKNVDILVAKRELIHSNKRARITYINFHVMIYLNLERLWIFDEVVIFNTFFILFPFLYSHEM